MYHPHMAKGILAGILDDVSSPSDVIWSCQGEVCTWAPYQTLAVCSFVEDVSADGTMLYVNSMGDSRVRTSMYDLGPGSWDWTQEELGSLPLTFWMNTQVDWRDPDARATDQEPLRNISTTLVGYYSPCNQDDKPRTDWTGQRNDAAN
ncbi:hypothetical protein Ptr902_08179 [Pyrenophora tritici-repentis]|nr:hypothetical protein Ptr902_08179 [Pyrenophora tritici-repentis]